MARQTDSIKKLQKESNFRLLKTKTVLIEMRLQIIKMKTSVLKVRIQALKDIALIGGSDMLPSKEVG